MRHTDCTVSLGRSEASDASQAGASQGSVDPARFPNRFCTVLIYLNTVTRGGRTCWRWPTTDALFYQRLQPSASNLFSRVASLAKGAREEVCIAPRQGMAVIHFPCTSPTSNHPLLCDPNADHESEVTAAQKYVCQQFIWSSCMKDARVDAELRSKFERFEADQPSQPLSFDRL